jgi:hypothetical protein
MVLEALGRAVDLHQGFGIVISAVCPLNSAVRMWPISTRVNKPENDDPSIVEPIELTTSAA